MADKNECVYCLGERTVEVPRLRHDGEVEYPRLPCMCVEPTKAKKAIDAQIGTIMKGII